MLRITGLDAAYGRAQVLFSVSVSVDRGEALAVLGPNGAGKSTLFKCVMGLVPPVAGDIVLDGHDLVRLDTHRIAGLGLGYVPEERRVFADLTVAENLTVGARAPRPGRVPWTRERLYALFPNLAALEDRLAGRISGGEQQMLAVARTLMGNPDLLLLDEPSEGLAPTIAEALRRTMAGLKASGLTLLISEQNLRFVSGLADRALVLETGRVRWTGPMAALAGNPRLRGEFLHA